MKKRSAGLSGRECFVREAARLGDRGAAPNKVQRSGNTHLRKDKRIVSIVLSRDQLDKIGKAL